MAFPDSWACRHSTPASHASSFDIPCRKVPRCPRLSKSTLAQHGATGPSALSSREQRFGTGFGERGPRHGRAHIMRHAPKLRPISEPKRALLILHAPGRGASFEAQAALRDLGSRALNLAESLTLSNLSAPLPGAARLPIPLMIPLLQTAPRQPRGNAFRMLNYPAPRPRSPQLYRPSGGRACRLPRRLRFQSGTNTGRRTPRWLWVGQAREGGLFGARAASRT